MEIRTASKRIFIILLGLIGLITAIFLYVGYFQHKFVLETLVNEERQVASLIYKNTFKQITEKYELIANNILSNQQIVDAFEKGDRDELLRLTAPIYNDLLRNNPYLTIMHFHTADTKSFLRLHKPLKFGDDLSDIRHMINNVNTLRTKQIGIEVGRYGIYYRMALPVSNKEGKHLGAFEFGIDINYIFDLFDKDYNFTTVLLLKKEIFEAIYENNKNLNYKSFSDEYYLIEPNSNPIFDLLPSAVTSEKYLLVSSSGKDNLAFTVTDLKSVYHEDIGKILFIKNMNFYTDQIKIIKIVTIASALIIILFSFYFLRRTFNDYTDLIQRYQNILEIKNRTLSKLANTDHLTKISNRKHIDKILKKELKRADRYTRPLSLIMLDVDDFKKINDTYGHHIGDRVLRQISKIVCAVIRDTDYFGRWGGEEFIILTPETSLENAVILAEKIRTLISQADFEECKTVTCSIGVSAYSGGKDSNALINNADVALYEAKNSGKDRVLTYTAD